MGADVRNRICVPALVPSEEIPKRHHDGASAVVERGVEGVGLCGWNTDHGSL